jgi:hypothetical protein
MNKSGKPGRLRGSRVAAAPVRKATSLWRIAAAIGKIRAPFAVQKARLGNAEINLGKSLSLFAKHSPFNSFRINKTASETAKLSTELPQIGAKQILYFQRSKVPS